MALGWDGWDDDDMGEDGTPPPRAFVFCCCHAYCIVCARIISGGRLVLGRLSYTHDILVLLWAWGRRLLDG